MTRQVPLMLLIAAFASSLSSAFSPHRSASSRPKNFRFFDAEDRRTTTDSAVGDRPRMRRRAFSPKTNYAAPDPESSPSAFSSSAAPQTNPKARLTTSPSRKRTPKPPRFVQAQLKLQPPPPVTAARGASTAANPSPRPESRRPGGRASRDPLSSLDRPSDTFVISADAKVDKDRMWRSSRSIEDLEKSLTERWGTDARTWTAGDRYDDEYDDDGGGNYDDDFDSVRSLPVLDPWAADSDSGAARRRRADNKEDPKRPPASSKLSVAHLIRDKPVGGRGTLQVVDDDVSERKGQPGAGPSTSTRRGFFFRSPAAASTTNSDMVAAGRPAAPQSATPVVGAASSNARTTTAPTAPEDYSSDSSRSSKNSGSPRRPIPTSTPLMDRDGTTPLYLTTQQAERNFQSILEASDEDDSLDDARTASSEDQEFESTLSSWLDFGVTSPLLLENLRRMECSCPLPVQRKVASFLLSPDKEETAASGSSPAAGRRGGGDVLVGTYTGSGKTLAFLVPLAEQLVRRQQDSFGSGRDGDAPLQVVVMAPGRELASQIVSVARELLEGTGLSVQLAIGGTTFSRNLELIRKRKPSILVGTPGRLAELFAGRPGEPRGRLGKVRPRTLVMDEFDALLEYKPHREKAHAVLQALKRDPSLQTILCSATASDLMGANQKVDQYLRPGYCQAMTDPLDVLVTPGGSQVADASDADAGTHSTPRVSRTVIHGVVHVPHRRFALDTLRRILHTEPLPQQVLVFVEDSRKVKIVVEKLERNGIIAAPLSGDDDKTDRADVSRALREGYVGLVVATELAARGLDAPRLTHVINWDLPTDASHYAHRAGRCGRGGREGVVINLTTSPQERSVPRKFAERLGIDMYTVEVRNARLNIVDPASQTLDA